MYYVGEGGQIPKRLDLASMALELARDTVGFNVKDNHSAINLYCITVSFQLSPISNAFYDSVQGVRTRPDAR